MSPKAVRPRFQPTHRPDSPVHRTARGSARCSPPVLAAPPSSHPSSPGWWVPRSCIGEDDGCSKAQVALADARKGVAMFQQDSINVPVLGIIENMSFFTPEELPNNKYYIFGKEGAKNLAEDLQVPFLGEIPLVQSIREAGDIGRPAALQTATPLEQAFEKLTQNVVQEVVRRNDDLPPTEAIKITTMAGCAAFKK